MAPLLPTVRLGGSGPEAIRLLPDHDYRPGDEFEAPTHPQSNVTFLIDDDLRDFGDDPVKSVSAHSVYLGASNTPQQHRRGEWYYKPEWVFVSLDAAKAVMGKVYGPGRLAKVFHLPVMALLTEHFLVLVTELLGDTPFRSHLVRLDGLKRDASGTGGADYVIKDGKFHPHTLRNAVRFFLSGKPDNLLKDDDWLFLLAPVELLEAEHLPPPDGNYLVTTRVAARNRPTKGLRKWPRHPEWKDETLAMSDASLQALVRFAFNR